MSNTDQLGALETEPETNPASWGQGTASFGVRLPILGPLDMSGLKQDKIASGHLQQYLQGGSQDILGPIGGSFKVRTHLPGHGGPTSGAMAASALETYLADVFGKMTIGPTGSTFSGAGTAIAPVTVASGTFPDGFVARTGALGDTRTKGQFIPVSSHAATTLNLLLALASIPGAADILHSAVNLYLPEDPTDAANIITGRRFRYVTPNNRYEMHGCYPMGLVIAGFNAGETPYVEVEWGVSWWKPTAGGAFPSATAVVQNNPAPVAAGSFCLNAVGQTARVEKAIRDFRIEIKLGVQPLPGPGGVNAYQTIVGAKRIPSTIKVTWTQDADTPATATPELEALHLAGTFQHAMLTLSTTAGSAMGVYFRNLCITGARPIQKGDGNVNRLSVEAMAYAGTTTTSALTLAAMILAFA